MGKNGEMDIFKFIAESQSVKAHFQKERRKLSRLELPCLRQNTLFSVLVIPRTRSRGEYKPRRADQP